MDYKVIAIKEYRQELSIRMRLTAIVLSSIKTLFDTVDAMKHDNMLSKLYVTLFNLGFWDMSNAPVSVREKVLKAIAPNILGEEEATRLQTDQLARHVMDSVAAINKQSQKLRTGETTKFEVFGFMLEQIAKLRPTAQIIGWYGIEAGEGKILPKELEAHYRNIIKQYGDYKNRSEEDIANIIEKKIVILNQEISQGPSRRILAVIDFKAGKDVSSLFTKKWQKTIAEKITTEGIEEPSKKSVLNLTAQLGKAIFVEHSAETKFGEIQSEKVVLLQAMGEDSYSIYPLVLSENPIKAEGENMAAELIVEFNNKLLGQITPSGSNNYGSVHIIDSRRRPQQEQKLLDGATELLLHSAAKLLSDIAHTELIEGNNRLLERLMLSTMGADYYALVTKGKFQEGQLEQKTVFFLDMVGFTAISQRFRAVNKAKEFMTLLNEFMGLVDDEIRQYGGTVDKYIGDAVMAPFSIDMGRAIEAAVAIQKKLPLINSKLKEKMTEWGIDMTGLDINVRIGIQSGESFIGSVGSRERWNITLIGMPVNEAARFEALNKFFNQTGIIVGKPAKDCYEKYHRDSSNPILFRQMYPIKVIGSTEVSEIYTVLGYQNDFSREEIELLYTRYNQAIDLLVSHQFDDAQSELKSIQTELTTLGRSDSLVEFYLDKIEKIKGISEGEEKSLAKVFSELKIGNFRSALISLLSLLQIEGDSQNQLAKILRDIIEVTRISKKDDFNVEVMRMITSEVIPILEKLKLFIKYSDETSLNAYLREKERLLTLHPFLGKLFEYLDNVVKDRDDVYLGNVSRFFFPQKKD